MAPKAPSVIVVTTRVRNWIFLSYSELTKTLLKIPKSKTDKIIQTRRVPVEREIINVYDVFEI